MFHNIFYRFDINQNQHSQTKLSFDISLSYHGEFMFFAMIQIPTKCNYKKHLILMGRQDIEI